MGGDLDRLRLALPTDLLNMLHGMALARLLRHGGRIKVWCRVVVGLAIQTKNALATGPPAFNTASVKISAVTPSIAGSMAQVREATDVEIKLLKDEASAMGLMAAFGICTISFYKVTVDY